MPKGIESFGMQAAQGAVGGVLGLAFGGLQNDQQLEQQKRLNVLNREMMDYQYSKQYDLWKKTGYVGQKEQMEKAGLNPALLYGMGGAGGGTTGSGSGGGSQASNQQSAIAMAQTATQLGLMKAQKENIEADTDLKKSQKPNVEAGTENTKADTVIKNAEGKIRDITASVTENTMYYAQEKIINEALATAQTLQSLEVKREIDQKTKEAVISKVLAESITATLHNELLQTEIESKKVSMDVAKANIAKINTEINAIGVELAQKWTSLNLEERKTLIYERVGKFNSSQSQRTYDNILKGIQSVAGALKPGTVINQGPKETTIINQ